MSKKEIRRTTISLVLVLLRVDTAGNWSPCHSVYCFCVVLSECSQGLSSRCLSEYKLFMVEYKCLFLWLHALELPPLDIISLALLSQPRPGRL
ncbi:hypothetical protein B0H11DRAFT_474015 [Mycena galericulata]|nr:hypothetical protein B0H11DRAFT_474015 [Mycena galericulata]